MELITFIAGRTSTPHLGGLVDGAPRTICNTVARGLVAATAAGGRLCQSCERGAAVLRSHVLRPEVRLLATARSTKAVGHYLIEGTSSAYCGVTVGEGAPAGDRVCKVCEALRVKVAEFDLAWTSSLFGHDVEADAPYDCAACEWVGRYAQGTAPARQEWAAHEETCQAPGADAEKQLVIEDVAATWREEWLTEGQQTIEGLLDEQGALFV